ncbi:MAG: sensor domain-containing diguanylate cyclase [Acidimicrobiales bacterium]|nr:sensor domain-containing diguanylate cyclase [Acidimicrobiales bacterium]
MAEIPERLFEREVVRRLLDDSPLLFVALTGDGHITWASDSTRRTLGWDLDVLPSSHISDLVHPDDLESVASTMTEDTRGAWERESMVVRVRTGLADDEDLDGYAHLEFGGLDLREPDGSGVYLVWGRSFETTTRLRVFMATLAAGAPLDELADQVLSWFEATSAEQRADLLVRNEDGTYQHISRDPARANTEVLAWPTERFVPDGPWLAADRSATLQLELAPGTLADPIGSAARKRDIEALWVVPIPAPGSVHPAALLTVWRENSGPPGATHGRRIETAMQFLRLALDWHASRAALVRAATTDPLTGLANRAHLASSIEADRSPLAAVLLCDLDDFKVVNDRHGHLTGDRVLAEVAARLSDAVRHGDLLARLGGDEFAVFCPGLTSAADAERVADRIVASLDVPFEVEGTRHRVGCSVGVAVATLADRASSEIDHLLGTADRAMYRAKGEGKGRWHRA